jgi:OFA family oxalate/formate antiporter-like MFS transporter
MLGLGLSGGASLYWFGVMVGPLSHRFGWSTSELSGWALVVHVTSYLLGPLSGVLIDRIGARTMALWSIPVVVAGFTGVGLGLHALWMLYLGAFVVGASNSCFTVFTRAINTWFSAGRGIALGIAYSGAGITSIVGPRLTLWVVDSYGWRMGFVFMGLLTLLPLPAAYFWLKERRFDEARQLGTPQGESGHAMRKALSLPAFWCIGGGCLLYFLAYNGIQFGLIPLLTEEGLSRANAADYAGLMGIFILVGKLASGLAFDRFRMAFALAGFLLADAFALIALGFFHRAGALSGLVVIGFTQGAMMSGFPYAVARYFGVKFFAGISGLISILLSLSAFGALLFSRLHDVFGSYHVSLAGASALLFGAAVLFRLLGRRPYFADGADRSASSPLFNNSAIRSAS